MTNLKEMSNEELLNRKNDYYTHQDILEAKAELLSQLKKAEDNHLLWGEIENLKCCGNCLNLVNNWHCFHSIGIVGANSYCNKWGSDNLKREERMIE